VHKIGYFFAINTILLLIAGDRQGAGFLAVCMMLCFCTHEILRTMKERPHDHD